MPSLCCWDYFVHACWQDPLQNSIPKRKEYDYIMYNCMPKYIHLVENTHSKAYYHKARFHQALEPYLCLWLELCCLLVQTPKCVQNFLFFSFPFILHAFPMTPLRFFKCLKINIVFVCHTFEIQERGLIIWRSVNVDLALHPFILYLPQITCTTCKYIL